MRLYTLSDPAEGGSSCFSVALVVQMLGQQVPNPEVELLNINTEVIGPDGQLTAIVSARNFSGNIIYTWHTYIPDVAEAA